MARLRVLRTYTFRIALGYLALFGLSAAALAFFVFWSTAGFIERQTDATINAEITGLAETYRSRGLRGLHAIIEERSGNQQQSLYVLADAAFEPLAGNLDGWPQAETQRGGWIDFSFERPVAGVTETHQARARHLRLGGGFQLLVGRDVQERRIVTERIRASLVWALAAMLGIGAAGAFVVSRGTLRRLEEINRTSREIMAGDLTRRVPISGGGDELDRLAENLNAMLARIEHLMTGMREVSDNIAHDLRTPLNRLRNRLEVALMKPLADADYRDVLEETIAEAGALVETFNALLAIARAESGALSRDMERLDPAPLVRDVVELYEPAAEDAGVRIEMRLHDGLAIRAHRPLLSQALSNLLDNALKHGAAGGLIEVEVRREGGAVVISVADRGPGIPLPERERVLERFRRLEASRSTQGSGLGLSLVRAVASLHDAELALSDNAPGLCVALRFPAAPAASPGPGRARGDRAP